MKTAEVEIWVEEVAEALVEVTKMWMVVVAEVVVVEVKMKS